MMNYFSILASYFAASVNVWAYLRWGHPASAAFGVACVLVSIPNLIMLAKDYNAGQGE